MEKWYRQEPIDHLIVLLAIKLDWTDGYTEYGENTRVAKLNENYYVLLNTKSNTLDVLREKSRDTLDLIDRCRLDRWVAELLINIIEHTREPNNVLQSNTEMLEWVIGCLDQTQPYYESEAL